VGLALGSGRDANLDSPLLEGGNDEKLGSEAGPLDGALSADALDGCLLGSSDASTLVAPAGAPLLKNVTLRLGGEDARGSEGLELNPRGCSADSALTSSKKDLNLLISEKTSERELYLGWGSSLTNSLSLSKGRELLGDGGGDAREGPRDEEGTWV